MKRRSRQRLVAPEAMEAILDRAGESRFARARSPIALKVWRDAVGARIADRARPVSLWGGVLLLRVPTSVWAHELSLLAGEVCTRLRERGIEARELRFRVGALEAVERPPERRVARAVPTSFAIPPELTHALDDVGDDSLRAAIERAAAANLAWQSVTRPAPPQEVSEARRAVRAPRGAVTETARPARATPASRASAPRTRGDGRDRSR
jgi:hypothetical protein